MVGDILQPTHLLLILVVALLVLGPKRLPEVGRTLGSGLRDFRAAINGETHDDPALRAKVDAEPDPVAPLETDGSETEPASLVAAAGDSAEPGDSAESGASEIEPATPTALHEHQLDPEALGDDLHAPAAVEDLHPPAATDDLQATDDLHPPAATDDLQATGNLHVPAATDDLQPTGNLHVPAATEDVQPTGDLYPPAATDDEGEAVSAPVATASRSGFASALASSRQRPAGGEPTADDE
jgi:sec-independent protein translocase protein TatA